MEVKINSVKLDRVAVEIEAADWLETHFNKSAFRSGVLDQALDFLDALDEAEQIDAGNTLEFCDLLAATLKNGASSWRAFSAGGCALCYNNDIEARYLPPSRRGHISGGELLEMQARGCMIAANALEQAFLGVYNRARGNH